MFDTPAAAEAANPVPAGQWESGGDTGAIYIYATLMKGGEVIGWSVSCLFRKWVGHGRAGVYRTAAACIIPRLVRALLCALHGAACPPHGWLTDWIL